MVATSSLIPEPRVLIGSDQNDWITIPCGNAYDTVLLKEGDDYANVCLSTRGTFLEGGPGSDVVIGTL